MGEGKRTLDFKMSEGKRTLVFEIQGGWTHPYKLNLRYSKSSTSSLTSTLRTWPAGIAGLWATLIEWTDGRRRGAVAALPLVSTRPQRPRLKSWWW